MLEEFALILHLVIQLILKGKNFQTHASIIHTYVKGKIMNRNQSHISYKKNKIKGKSNLKKFT